MHLSRLVSIVRSLLRTRGVIHQQKLCFFVKQGLADLGQVVVLRGTSQDSVSDHGAIIVRRAHIEVDQVLTRSMFSSNASLAQRQSRKRLLINFLSGDLLAVLLGVARLGLLTKTEKLASLADAVTCGAGQGVRRDVLGRWSC